MHLVTPSLPVRALFSVFVGLAASSAQAAEGYKLRQAPVGAFGGEMASGADNPGLFGTASLTQIDIYKVVDGSGNEIQPQAVPSVQLTPNFKLNFPAGTLDIRQKQTQLNLLGGYLSDSVYAGGRMAFAVNVPLITLSRSFVVTQATGTVSPTPTAPPLTTTQVGQLSAAAQQANSSVQARVLAASASQNADVTGLGDTELSVVWVRHQDRLKVAAGASVFLPTGEYDRNRGPNPGFGNFLTLRPGVAVSYSLNPDHSQSNWDSGVTVAGRLSYGINSVNVDTDYRSGNFVYAELGLVKVTGNWAFGANILTVRQVTDDSGAGATLGANRYRNNGFGPFVSYKLPGQDAGFNLQYSENFGSENALVAKYLQLRFIKAW
ncbi:MAG: transporter [Rhodoferax sp.]|nr:transporter [Rhodoferax sp.]